ncbi:ankyrin repeat and SOCS box protein 13-like isoform X3 [Periophthalmus magnuspinnatus]|uniref:ankyrin repeat and SOCS box protein 13-like isoform X3 n=1 Tax=Periophthalmus magnuspinnatus TaxID=409849 RepID=UPI002436B033|nr:ankyrin repeat and SOCS box protein 13-like isoform X3 [Periophthalmus magnuspinnatus]
MEVTAARRSFLCDIGMWADRTALHEAASMGRVLQLSQLIDSGSSVNTVTVDNVTALHEACIKGHPNCVRLLLRAGAQVRKPPSNRATEARINSVKFHETALHLATRGGSVELMEMLIEFGADVFYSDNSGNRPRDYAVEGTDPYLCLTFFESNPLSLQQICRIRLRSQLGPRAFRVIPELQISPWIKNYLLFSDTCAQTQSQTKQ